MIDFDALRTVLWLVVGLLMAGGLVGLGLALLLGESTAEHVETRSVRVIEARSPVAVEVAPARPVDEKVLKVLKAAYRRGLYVLVGLVVLTALEFLVAVALGGSPVFLFIIALAKAGVILQYFMHVGRVWGEEEAH
jgi:cytochrome c oxidase subunit 4